MSRTIMKDKIADNADKLEKGLSQSPSVNNEASQTDRTTKALLGTSGALMLGAAMALFAGDEKAAAVILCAGFATGMSAGFRHAYNEITSSSNAVDHKNIGDEGASQPTKKAYGR